MTDHAMMQLQAEFARVACRQCTEAGLQALRESADRAVRLGGSWESRAAAYAEFHCLLAEVTGGSAYYLLATLMSGSVLDMIARAGPESGEFIAAAHRRLIRKLEERDADGAAEEMDCYVTLLSHYQPAGAC
jgi:DNA-binding FadR family transcriptional regulator